MCRNVKEFAKLIGASMDNKMGAVFGKGGANPLTFSGMGKTLVAKMVVSADARRAMGLLGFAWLPAA